MMANFTCIENCCKTFLQEGRLYVYVINLMYYLFLENIYFVDKN